MKLDRLKNDDGVGIILVLGISFIVIALIATALVLATNVLGQSRIRTNFELSLASAEAGIDSTLALLQEEYDADPGNVDFGVPTEGDACSVASGFSHETYPTAGTDPEQQVWAQQQMQTMSAFEECRTATDAGEFVVFKPKPPSATASGSAGRVYATGAAPTFETPEQSLRTLRVDYQFLPYKPQHAILTSGDMSLDSSTLVTTAGASTGGACDVTGSELAAVHTNSTFATVTGNPTVCGLVSSTDESSGSSNRFEINAGGAITTKPPVYIPTVSASQFYRRTGGQSVAPWYDLCVEAGNAVVRPYSSNGPCDTTTTPVTGVTGVELSWDGSQPWFELGRNAGSGVYFAHGANIEHGVGRHEFDNVTLVASRISEADCSAGIGGDINWVRYELAAPAVTNLFMLADGDLDTGANFTAGNDGTDGSAVQSGMFVAGDDIDMSTSSQGAVGSVLAADRCDDGEISSIQNPSVYFDPDANSPFSTIVNQTLWFEFN